MFVMKGEIRFAHKKNPLRRGRGEKNFLATIFRCLERKLKIVHLNVKEEIIHKHKTYAQQ